MTTFGLVLFGAYLLGTAALDVAMIVSLARPGDERRQLMVWKAGTWALVGTAGTLVFSIARSVVRAEALAVNPLAVLTAAATVYFLSLLYYRKRYGG